VYAAVRHLDWEAGDPLVQLLIGYLAATIAWSKRNALGDAATQASAFGVHPINDGRDRLDGNARGVPTGRTGHATVASSRRPDYRYFLVVAVFFAVEVLAAR
jgi:hypothetical protein